MIFPTTWLARAQRTSQSTDEEEASGGGVAFWGRDFRAPRIKAPKPPETTDRITKNERIALNTCHDENGCGLDEVMIVSTWTDYSDLGHSARHKWIMRLEPESADRRSEVDGYPNSVNSVNSVKNSVGYCPGFASSGAGGLSPGTLSASSCFC